MKNKLLLPVILFLVGGCIGAIITFTIVSNKLENNQAMLDHSRDAVIALNKKYNETFQLVMRECLKMLDNQYDPSSFRKLVIQFPQELQDFFLPILEVNRSLQLDCVSYSEDGKPKMCIGEDGQKHVIERLPETKKVK